MPLQVRCALTFIFAICLIPEAAAQVVRGRVVDADTKAPISLVETRLLAENDSSVDLVLTTDSGAFVLRGRGTGKYALELRRVGFQRLVTTHIRLSPGDTMTVDLELGRIDPVSLDTVRVEEKRSWWSSATPGHTWLQRHAKRGIGVFIAGAVVEHSGLLLSEYLGRIEGLSLTGVTIRGYPVIPARNGMFVTSTFPSRCLYARIDHQSLAHYLISTRRETIDEALKLNQIAAIEIYRERAEIPEEWKDAGFVRELFYRRNAGIEYLLGHPANTEISVGMLEDDAYGARSATRGLLTDARGLNVARPDLKQLVTRENLSTPTCGFLQIWTIKAW
jgi:hypothetical protein